MERFKRRLRTIRNHHTKCEERLENALAEKDHCPSSGEHAPLKERPGDEPDKACQHPTTPSPSREDEVLTEESQSSSHSGSDAGHKPPSSPSSNEDEVLTQESQSSRYSAPEKHHSHSSSSNTEIGQAKDQKAKSKSVHIDVREPDSTSASSSVDKPKRIATITQDDDGDDEDSGDSEHDAKDRKRHIQKTGKKRKRQDDDDWDGDDRETTASRSPGKGPKKTARERSDVDVKKLGKRPWTDKERTAVKRRLAKFIAMKEGAGKTGLPHVHWTGVSSPTNADMERR